MATIENVPIKNTTLEPAYDSNDGSYAIGKELETERANAENRQTALSEMYNSLENGNRTKSLDIWESARTPNSFSVNSQQALNPFIKLKSNENVAFFDIEALGVPEHMRVGKSKDIDLFAITELSFGGTRFTGNEFAKSQDVISMAIAPSKNEYNRLKAHIERLKKNPLAGVTQDMHRTLLDLAKYSDVGNFAEQSTNGKAYTSLLAHKRVPAAGAAFTRNTIGEIEIGLENLYNKGTKWNHALSILQDHMIRNNAKLGGFNIHTYDLPAIIGTTKNAALRDFFQAQMGSSLDFYHAFNATQKDPYNLAGASLRQQNIHQFLLNKKAGKNRITKPELPFYQYHFAAHDITANREIAGFMTGKINKFIKKAKSNVQYDYSPNKISTQKLKLGQDMFSFQSGWFDPVRHQHTLITRDTGKKNVAPRWSGLNTSLPANEHFRVSELLKDVALPNSSKTGFGVRFDSKDIKGKSVLMFAETESELAQLIHGSFLPSKDIQTQAIRNLKVMHSDPFREYEKMFDYSGWKNMNNFYNYLDGGNARINELLTKGRISNASEFDWKRYISSLRSDIPDDLQRDSLALKFPHMVARLEGERAVWGGAMKELRLSGLNDDQKSLALRHIKNQLDAKGLNKAEVAAEGGRFFSFDFGNDDIAIFNAKNTDSIKSAIRGHINGGRRGERVGNPEKSYKLARIDELSNIIIENFQLKGQGAKYVSGLAESMKEEVFSGQKIETALTSMSNFVRDRVESRGSNSFIREVTNTMTTERAGAIKSLSGNLPEVIQQSITSARAKQKAKDAIDGNPILKRFLEGQDSRIKSLFEQNFGAYGMNSAESIEKAGRMAAKYEQLVGDIFSAYSNDFSTKLSFTKDKKPLLILGDKKSGMNLSERTTYEELVRNPKLAVIELPHFDADNKVVWGNNKKASIIRSGIRNGDAYHSTSVTDALNMILDYSKKAKELSQTAEFTGKRNLFVELRQGLRYRVSKQVDPVPTLPNRKLGFDDKTMFDLPSTLAGEVRSAKWDITGYAETWYNQNWRRLGFSKSPAEVATLAKQRGVSFYDAMDGRARGLAITENGLLQTAKNVPNVGLRGSYFGANNRTAGMGYVMTGRGDARMYNALGNYYSDSVENPQKTVNYRKLDHARTVGALNAAGKNDSFRYLNSFVSDAAHEALTKNNEWRGLTLQTGYVTDEEVAMKLKDASTLQRYKRMIQDSNAPDYMKRQMMKALDMGMLSTSEGMAMMDYRLLQAFDGTDEVRINTKADSVQLHKRIEDVLDAEAIKQGIVGPDGKTPAWKTQGIKLDNPIDLDLSGMINKNNQVTVGKYTINNVKDKIIDEKHFRKNDKVTVLGFNVDDPFTHSLVLGRERKTGQGFKGITEGGFRGTFTPMLSEIMSDIYGVAGTEQLISHLDGKGATDLSSLIRGYDLKIREKYGKGAASHLEKYYQDVKDTLGIGTQLEANGQYTVARDFGMDGKELSYKDRIAFSKKWMGELGLSREAFAEITMAHDVWNRQGALNNAKITLKELDMLDRSYERTDGYDPLKKSAHSRFLRELVYGKRTSPEIRAEQKVFAETIKTALNYDKGWTPKAGDAVIDFTSDGMAVMSDVNAQFKDGVLHVSKDAFEKIPERAGHNQVFTVGDYAKTVLNAGDVQFNVTPGHANPDKYPTLQSFLLKNKGTAYMKLPEFAGNQYIPLLDINSMKIPGINGEDRVKFLNVMEGHYAKIIRKTDEYNNTFAPSTSPTMNEERAMEWATNRKAALAEEINTEVSGLIGTLGDATSNEGMAKIMARRLDNSSQFQFGGVNPVLSYTKENGKWSNTGLAKEGHVYMNELDVRNLVGKNEKNIAKSWGVDLKTIEGDMSDWVMKNWNNYDTFATTIRYPSIDSGTTQSMKLKISEAVGRGQVIGLRGMAERISGDHDGDNVSVIMTQYGIKNDQYRNQVLGDMRKLNAKDTAANSLQAGEIMKTYEGAFQENLRGVLTKEKVSFSDTDIQRVTDQFYGGGLQENITLGSLHGAEAHEHIRKAMESTMANDKTWGKAKNGFLNELGEYTDNALFEHEKSILARSNFTAVGSIDNTRMKLSSAFMSLSKTKYKMFGNVDGDYRYSRNDYVQDTAIVDEFLREFSQKTISAKKLEGSTATAEDYMRDLYGLIDSINNPSTKLDYNEAASQLKGMGMFKNKPFLEIGDGEVWEKTSNEDFMSRALRLLGGAEETFSEMGIQGNRQSSLLLGASQGIGFDKLAGMLKTGEHLPGTNQTDYLNKVAKEFGYNRMDIHQANYEKAVERVHTRRIQNGLDRLEDGGMVQEIMDTSGRIDSAIQPNGQSQLYRTMKDEMVDTLSEISAASRGKFSGSAAGMLGFAAAGFGGLWATTALTKGTPTPEGLAEMAPVSPQTLGSPSARVTPNGEYINIRVKADAAKQMSHNDLAAMLNNEVMAMSNVKMATSVNVNDNSQKIDKSWLENAVANVMTKGYAYN